MHDNEVNTRNPLLQDVNKDVMMDTKQREDMRMAMATTDKVLTSYKLDKSRYPTVIRKRLIAWIICIMGYFVMVIVVSLAIMQLCNVSWLVDSDDCL